MRCGLGEAELFGVERYAGQRGECAVRGSMPPGRVSRGTDGQAKKDLHIDVRPSENGVHPQTRAEGIAPSSGKPVTACRFRFRLMREGLARSHPPRPFSHEGRNQRTPATAAFIFAITFA
jgi:hypothetical protein